MHTFRFRLPLMVIIVVLVAFVAAGCGDNNDSNTATTGPTSTERDVPPPQEQIDAAQKVLDEKPNDKGALMRMSIGCIGLSNPDPKTGKMDDEATEHLDCAVEHLERLVKVDPKNSFAKQLLGDVYSRSGEYDKAEPIFRELANSTNPKNPAYYIAWATAAQQAGHRAEALKAYREVVKRFPKDPVAGAARQQIEQLEQR